MSDRPHRILEVLDKGKAAAVTTIVETRDKRSGKVIFENQSTVFIRGAGGFGGKRAGKGRFMSIISLIWSLMVFFQRIAVRPLLRTLRPKGHLMLYWRRKQALRRQLYTGMFHRTC